MTTYIIGHKYHFCREKYVFDATKQFFLSRQRQKYLCRDKHIFVEIKLSRQSMLVATTVLLRQTRVCRDKNNLARQKTYILLSQQMHVLSRQNTFCGDIHVFVAAKIILVAAPANDKRNPKALLPYTTPWCQPSGASRHGQGRQARTTKDDQTTENPRTRKDDQIAETPGRGRTTRQQESPGRGRTTRRQETPGRGRTTRRQETPGRRRTSRE